MSINLNICECGHSIDEHTLNETNRLEMYCIADKGHCRCNNFKSLQLNIPDEILFNTESENDTKI